jgi:hypothetical protein
MKSGKLFLAAKKLLDCQEDRNGGIWGKDLILGELVEIHPLPKHSPGPGRVFEPVPVSGPLEEGRFVLLLEGDGERAFLSLYEQDYGWESKQPFSYLQSITL